MLAPNMSWIIPYISVSDVSQSLAFYQAAFGFQPIDIAKDHDNKAIHAEMRYQDMVIMIGLAEACDETHKTPKQSGHLSPISIYVYVNDVNQFYQHAVAQGAVSLGEPEDMFWGDRCCRLQDQDGYIWCFGSHLNKS